MLSFVAIAVIGGSLVMDLSGRSTADSFVLSRWSFPGLRAYLWLEGGLLVAIVTTLGTHIISTGLRVTREGTARFFGMPARHNSRVPAQIGYVFIVLGCALVALSLTTLVLLNSCRYMRLI